jgi:hypothetical protein
MKLANGLALNSHPSGRQLLQIPGPANVPDRILRAIDCPTIDHRGPELATRSSPPEHHRAGRAARVNPTRTETTTWDSI